MSVAAAFLACLGIMRLAAGLDGGVAALPLEQERLHDTLTAAETSRIAGEGPTIWAVIEDDDCTECAAFVEQDLTTLRREGFEIRLIDGEVGLGIAERGALALVAARNGATLRLPALFWRAGGEWRARFGRDPEGWRRLHTDFEPQA